MQTVFQTLLPIFCRGGMISHTFTVRQMSSDGHTFEPHDTIKQDLTYTSFTDKCTIHCVS